MKYLIEILFLTFISGTQTDTVRVDTVHQEIHQNLEIINNDLDSIIAILKKDTINNKKF